MDRRALLSVGVLFGLGAGAAVFVPPLASGSPALVPAAAQVSEACTTCFPYVVRSGDSWIGIANRYNLSGNELARQNRTTISFGLQPGMILWVNPGPPPSTTTTTSSPATTTTTVASTTTVPPTSTSTTTTSTSTTTTTSSSTTTSTVAPSTTIPDPTAFIETFADGEAWRDRWDLDVHHRTDLADSPPGQPLGDEWRADHDASCGGADTFRMIDALGDRSQHFYRCAPSGEPSAHVMTSMGDVDGYSVLSFAPKQTFPTVRRVCWDQNVTDSGGRQWTEVVVVPASAVADGDLTHVNPEFVGVDHTTNRHTAESWGVMVHSEYHGLRVFANGSQIHNPYYAWDRDSAGKQSRAIRRQHCLAANDNNTVTLTIDQGVNGTFAQTFPGHFPAGARVIFEQHSYTPDKDGEACRPVGLLSGCRYTWHWDNLTVEG